MLQRNNKFNGRLGALTSPRFALFGLAFTSVALCGLLPSGDAKAASCDDDSASCVEVNFGTMQGDGLTVTPGLSYYDSTKFYLPVEIGLKSASLYTVKVYGSGSSLVSGTESIPSIGTDTSYEQLGQNGSEWGIRWNFGDTIEDKETSYHRIPASSDDDGAIVVENQYLKKSSTIVRKQLTLGFAVAVGANQPSGDYTNTITVAVVASPRDARSFFDISTMQEMTPEICANTTTPDRTATTKFDTDASHPEDANYVPQTTLTDTRNGRSYLIRKLADGNCWMSQNLSLHLSANTPLTSDNTDLNSKTSWTPVNNTESSATVWAEDGKDRSYSGGWTSYWAGGTTFNSTGATAYGGAVGYAQRGIYYNWFAATAGSGKTTDTDATTDGDRIINGVIQDSICPKGWTLPTGNITAVNTTDGSVKSFYNLVQLYTGKTGNITNATTSTLYISPMNFVPAGFYIHSSATVSNAGVLQFYWSNTAASVSAAFTLGTYDDVARPGTNGERKSYGFSIRCVAR